MSGESEGILFTNLRDLVQDLLELIEDVHMNATTKLGDAFYKLDVALVGRQCPLHPETSLVYDVERHRDGGGENRGICPRHTQEYGDSSHTGIPDEQHRRVDTHGNQRMSTRTRR